MEPLPDTSVLEAQAVGDDAFSLKLDNFDGPFDLLLTLIGNRKLDVTELALSEVTGEFIRYVSKLDDAGSIDKASEFIVVAATLLDLKIASLLPAGDVVDREDVALLEARDLLFARLLQYRAFKEASKWLSARLDAETGRHARQVKLERKYVERTPELVWTLTPEDFAALALLAMTPREIPTVGLDHLHAPLVSIREQAAEIVAQLRGAGSLTFRELVAGAASRGVVVARFLAALELYRRSAVTFEQVEPLGELTITWSGRDFEDESLATLGADYS